jgi:hypothetical protein
MMAQISARNLRHPAPSFLLVPKGSRDWKILIGIFQKFKVANHIAEKASTTFSHQ